MKCFTPSEKSKISDMGFIAAWNSKAFGFVFMHRQKCFVFVPVCKTICFMPSLSQGKTEMVLACWARQASCTGTDAPGPNITQDLSTCVIFSFWPSLLGNGREGLTSYSRREMLIPVGASGNFTISIHRVGTLPNTWRWSITHCPGQRSEW